MKSIKLSLLVTMLFIILIQGCKKSDNENNQDTDWLAKMEELEISGDFNYTSTTSQSLKITLPFTVDYDNYRGRVDVLAGDENGDEFLIGSGGVDASGVYNTDLTFPSIVDELIVRSPFGTALIPLASKKQLMNADVNFGDGYDTLPPRDTATLLSFSTSVAKSVMRSDKIKELSLSQNLVQNGDFNTNEFGDMEDWPSPMVADGKWYVTSHLKGYAGQYNDAGENVLRIEPSPNRYGGVAQLIEASPGDLITFKADVKTTGSGYKRIWMFIISRNANGNSSRFFSILINPNSEWQTFTLAASMPNGTETVQILLWQHIFGGNIYWDNVVVTGPTADSDGDGVDDDLDDYPDDAARAYDIYYPSMNEFGSLAFEDNWPGKGDYDFNDLVVDYQYRQVTNAENELVELFGKYVIRAIGASYTNGFGFEMDLQPADIQNVTGISVTDGYINLLSNNSEANQARGTIIVTDNAFTQLPHPGGGTGVNTTPGQPYVEPDTMNIYLLLDDPVPISQAGYAPYNPFIIVDQVRGREVHLPDETPTSLADPAYFGTMNDDSDPATGKYYKTANNLPWALDVPSEFDYPVEKTVIIQAYLHFAEWAESSGSYYSDWYLDKAGYRDNDVIYQPGN